MKKRCTMLLAIVLSLTLAGCGSSGASETTEAAESVLATESISANAEETAISSETLPAETEEPEPTELTFVIGTSGEAETVWWNQLKEDFEAAYSDIELTLTLVARDAVDITVKELVEIGQTPDLSNASLTETNINAGVYVPAREYLSEELRGDILSGAWSSVSIDGTGWGVPLLCDCYGVYYNPSILNEAGVTLPETWSQVTEVSQAILDYYGFEVYPWGVNLTTDEGAFTFACYIYNNGGAFLTDSAWSLNSEENKAAMTYLTELINWGYTNHDPAEDSFDTLLELFREGEQAMFIGPYSLEAEVAETGQSYAVGQLPANDGLTACSVGIASTLTVFADDTEENPEARTEAITTLLDFLFDAERYTALSEAVGLFPVTNTAISALTEQRALSGSWEAVLTNCRFLPRWKDGWDTVNARLVDLEQATLTGEDSAALLDSLQAEISPTQG